MNINLAMRVKIKLRSFILMLILLYIRYSDTVSS